MKKSKFTESQIVFALHQAETGTRVGEVCRKMGISEATFYNWKKKFGGLDTSELRRLRQLEEENARLKKLVADLSLDKHMLQEVTQKKAMRPARRRELARWLVEQYRVSERRAGNAAGPIHISLPAGRAVRRTPSGPDSRNCPCAGALRILAHLRVASPGRMDSESQARIPALQAGGA